METLTKIWEWIKSNISTILCIVVIILLIIFWNRSCTNARNERAIAEQNITALTDSVVYYRGQTDQLVAEKTMLLGDIETLENANSDLVKQLEEMKVDDPNVVIGSDATIDYGKHDTIWRIDTVDHYAQAFNFDDQWRKLNGTITLDKQILSMVIDTDKVFADLTFAIEDNKVYATSQNPYLVFSDIQAIQMPEYEPTWCLVIGPSINVGYGPGYINTANGWQGGCGINGSVGISLTFGWNIVGCGKRVKR